VIWGDPHIIGFDAYHKHTLQNPLQQEFLRVRSWKLDEVTVTDEGTFWIVKSQDVHIQGRYGKLRSNAHQTMLTSMAVGGPFLKNNTFAIQPLTGKVTWNGQNAMPHGLYEFSNDLVHVRKNMHAEIVKNGQQGPGLEVSLPQGVKLTVNRLKHGLAAKISMCRQVEQEGQCGNFNGDPNDEVQEMLTAPTGRVAENERFL